MSDRLRSALAGGGSIHISVETDGAGDFSLLVTESWERLTGVRRLTIPAGELDAAPDPDGLIRERLADLAGRHLNRRAREDAAGGPSGGESVL